MFPPSQFRHQLHRIQIMRHVNMQHNFDFALHRYHLGKGQLLLIDRDLAYFDFFLFQERGNLLEASGLG
ncbi:hypothetical protein D1872_332550 [compost metagenome]